MTKLFSCYPAHAWLFVLSVFMLLLLPLRAETLRGPGGLPPGLVAAMLGRMQGKTLDARGCARLGDLRGCFGREGARFRGAGKDVELRTVAWGREGRLERLRWRSVGRKGSREVYRGRGIEAWWRAVPLGYEEGFELMRRPRGRGPVEVELEANRVGRKVGGGIRWGEVRYGKLWVTDARGRRVPAVLRAEGRKIWIRIEGRGWKYPLRVDPLVWLEQAASLPSGLGSDSGFGYSVALSGNGEVAIVGVPGVNSGTGAAYVYTYDSTTGTWGAPVELGTPNGTTGFGASVALSSGGTVALVGAPKTTYVSTGELGAVYVYTYNSSTESWSSAVTLSFPSGLGAGTGFGDSLALSGNGEVALVGAPYGNYNAITGLYEGAAFVYTNNGTGWSNTPVTLSVPSGAGELGYSVALSSDGTVALVGAPTTNSDLGVAYVYTNNGTGWSNTPVTLSVPSGAGDFGYSVALSANGTVALVGAPVSYINANTGTATGAAFVYTSGTEAWSSTSGPAALTPPSSVALGSDFGNSVSVALSGSEEVALVGALATNSDAGAAYVYTSSGTWSNTSTPEATLPVPTGGEFGYSMALSSDGAEALVGAPYTSTSSSTDVGAAYFYGSADLDLVLDAPSTVTAGTDYTEQAILTNSSGYASPDLTVNLPIPAGTNYQSSSATPSSQGTCTTSTSPSGVVSSVNCDVGVLAANGGSATSSVTLGVPSSTATGTEIAETAQVSNATPTLSAQATTGVQAGSTTPPTISGLTNETVTVGNSVPPENFTITGTGTLTVTASSSNTTLLADSGIAISSGCDTSGASCTLTLTPVSGQVGITTVTVTVTDAGGQAAVDSITLDVASSSGGSSGGSSGSTSGGGGGGSVGLGMLMCLLILAGFRKQRRRGQRA